MNTGYLNYEQKLHAFGQNIGQFTSILLGVISSSTEVF